jgi:hypothetical protein
MTNRPFDVKLVDTHGNVVCEWCMYDFYYQKGDFVLINDTMYTVKSRLVNPVDKTVTIILTEPET